MLLRLSNIGKAYGGNEVLQKVSFQVNDGERVGVVGRNGAGKSTLFRLITGEETPDAGTLSTKGGLQVAVLEQQIDLSASETVRGFALSAFQKLKDIKAEMHALERLMQSDSSEMILDRYSKLQTEFETSGGFVHEARAESVLLGLGFNDDAWHFPADQLSGGQQTRLRLAQLLLSDADLMLLDEPTNHLDFNSVKWLVDFLQTCASSSLIISHDRYFLDQVASQIIEIERGKAYSYKGNYSQFLVQSELRKKQQRHAYANQQAFISKTEAFIRKNLAGQKTRQAQSRRRQLAKLKRIDRAEIADAKTLGDLRLGKIKRASKILLSVKDLQVGYQESLATVNLELASGDCVGVIGRNGAGKTTLLKTLCGETPTRSGSVIWGKNSTVGYYSQNLDELKPNNDVLSELRRVSPLADKEELRSFLAQFLFIGDDVETRVGKLSGGEKSRLSLAKLIYTQPNVLLLDEPTNHLDMPSREALERALQHYEGAILTVSHDRYFLNQLATQIFSFEPNGKIEIFNGNYSEFHEWKERNIILELSKIDGLKKEPCSLERTKKRNSPETVSPNKNETRKIRNRINEVEKIISQIEEKLKQIMFMMNREDVATNHEDFVSLSKNYEINERKLNKMYSEWENLLEKIS